MLYLTADTLGTPTGGGVVTKHEAAALSTLGECVVWDREFLQSRPCFNAARDPWCWDEAALASLETLPRVALCHVYAGTFSHTVNELRRRGTVVTYTCAAHDIPSSKRAHEELGIPYAYPHLTDPALWGRYSAGMRDADVVVCPSTVAEATCRRQGFTNRIEVIPHGCELPAKVRPLPKRFTVGYLGSHLADKGIVYLLKAWKHLAYRDATLILAGRDSTHPMVQQMWRQVGGGAVELRGWVDDVSEFYGRISLYVQPSCTEGFGIEVLEAMAHGRPVVCSRGAGASDLIDEANRVPAFDAESLAKKIAEARWVADNTIIPLKEGKVVQDEVVHGKLDLAAIGRWNRQIAERHTWDIIRQRYVDLWKGLL